MNTAVKFSTQIIFKPIFLGFFSDQAIYLQISQQKS